MQTPCIFMFSCVVLFSVDAPCFDNMRAELENKSGLRGGGGRRLLLLQNSSCSGCSSSVVSSSVAKVKGVLKGGLKKT